MSWPVSKVVAPHRWLLFRGGCLSRFDIFIGGHGGEVVTHSPPTSEVSGSNPRPYVGKLVVAYTPITLRAVIDIA